MPALFSVAKARHSAYAYGYRNLSPFIDLATSVFPGARVGSSIGTDNTSLTALNDADAKN
ncbi:hypothetical protein DL96DRAFT_1706706 [Flagelloscypha sp. PMI_526]|nr:hypothetical protein DL96DRAFT_1706706 [Flagelloscypha sp. PMI_526]